MVFKISVVVMVGLVVAMMLAERGEGANPGRKRARHWEQWRQLRLRHREEQQQQLERQQQQLHQQLHHPHQPMDPHHMLHHPHQPMDPHHMQHHRGWSIHEARRQQLLRERQLELEQDMREEMEDIIKDNMLEEFAMQLSVDALGSILRPMRQMPLHHQPDCVTRTAPATLMRLGLAGHFEYVVCGSMDGAAMHIHFRTLGGTTPSLDTTTPAADTTTPAQPLCPTVPGTTPDTTTPEPTTTTPEPNTPQV